MRCAIDRLVLAAAALSLAIGGCGSARAPGESDVGQAPAAAGSKPDLSACKPTGVGTSAEIERERPLRMPAKLSGIAISDLDHIAVLTLAGGTVCVDTSWIGSIGDMTLSPDKRFLSFAWSGYEDFGYHVVDRSGNGAVLDTGVEPVAAPTGKLIAAVEYSESGFGSLNALGIWDIAARPARELAIVQFPEGYTEWRFDGWTGDACIAVSAARFEAFGEGDSGPPEPARDRFVSKAGNSWQLEPAGKEGCGAP